ncbi:hypothetical protein V474_02815 [Novosphingobium barchaimii LL02]|uniref:Uncharacterized protein n=1 Tax=Novosphingobium barchaimii LL02 TaxID=1114963 RepID=A0A0J7XLP6_9SPHN|nr:hypothetical protein [Novosphingobium barchaimii]KMS51998.1 hypothetical protein V474_02815 [Novosphingobium barchaimii LL02]
MVPTIAQLVAADEYLSHQTANTFDTVATEDLSWTEKVWFTLARKDGTLQASFGLGKYTNRNLIDGFAGVQIGTQQRTVRASRVLRPCLDLVVGPLRYEIIEPMRQLRLSLAPNAAQPISYDLVWTAHAPAFFEDRDLGYAAHRNSSNVVRYHQAGTVSGWIEVDGERHHVDPEEWFGFRDHSWGVREHVGSDPADLPPAVTSKIAADYQFNWFVSCLSRPDGSRYELAYYFREFREPRGLDWFTAYINEENGRQIPILQIHPELTYRKSDHAVMGGRIYALMRGEGRRTVERVFEVEALDSEMGFRLNPGMYGAWKGQIHGSYMGEDFLDGECIDNVNDPARFAASRRWEIRDRPLRIREGDAVGFANIESIVIGDWPAATFV